MKFLTAFLFVAVATMCAEAAFAQSDAGAKARGHFDFYGRGARSAMRGARESTSSFREYVRITQPSPSQVGKDQPGVIVVSPQIAQAAADEIGDYITKSEKHLAWMRRQAEAWKDGETLASLDSIDRNLAEAKKNHITLCGRCIEENVSDTAAMACCQKIDDALAKAISEHDSLMKRLSE